MILSAFHDSPPLTTLQIPCVPLWLFFTVTSQNQQLLLPTAIMMVNLEGIQI